MKFIAAYLLAALGGNKTPSAHDIKTILASVGIEAENERIELLLSQVKGKDLTELIASGREKMASIPTSGEVAAAVNAVLSIIPAAPVAAEKEEKEDVEESDEDIGYIGLFDDM